jgi:hypothetical protein
MFCASEFILSKVSLENPFQKDLFRLLLVFREVLSSFSDLKSTEKENSFSEPNYYEPRDLTPENIQIKFSNEFLISVPSDLSYIVLKNEDDLEKTISVHIPFICLNSSYLVKWELSALSVNICKNINNQSVESRCINSIFAPNKPSQLAPSIKDSMLYIPIKIKR